MPQIAVTEVKVVSRFRKKFDAVEELASSIETYGLLHPIVVDEDNKLIAGERRLRAHMLLFKRTKDEKWAKIEVKRKENLTELEKKEIELEENLQRESFTWPEEVAAKSELHKLKQKMYGSAVRGHESDGWKLKDTANALGESPGNVSMDIQLARGLKVFPDLKKEKSKSTAFKKLKQRQQQIMQEELSKRLKTQGILDRPEIIQGNCIEEMAKMEAESIDLVLTDPPFGIDLGKAQTFKENYDNVYPVDGDNYTIFDMLDKACAEIYRVLKHDRHTFVFCGIDHFQKLRDILMKHGFDVHHLPLIWDKGSGSYPSQSTTFVHSYEAILHCRKGKRQLNGTPRDIFPVKRVPSQRKIHPTEKPTELLRTLISLGSSPGEKVLDPFAGSGSTLVAAKETSRQCIGIELDEKFHAGICKRLEGGGEDETVSK